MEEKSAVDLTHKLRCVTQNAVQWTAVGEIGDNLVRAQQVVEEENNRGNEKSLFQQNVEELHAQGKLRIGENATTNAAL